MNRWMPEVMEAKEKEKGSSVKRSGVASYSGCDAETPAQLTHLFHRAHLGGRCSRLDRTADIHIEQFRHCRVVLDVLLHARAQHIAQRLKCDARRPPFHLQLGAAQSEAYYERVARLQPESVAPEWSRQHLP